MNERERRESARELGAFVVLLPVEAHADEDGGRGRVGQGRAERRRRAQQQRLAHKRRVDDGRPKAAGEHAVGSVEGDKVAAVHAHVGSAGDGADARLHGAHEGRVADEVAKRQAGSELRVLHAVQRDVHSDDARDVDGGRDANEAWGRGAGLSDARWRLIVAKAAAAVGAGAKTGTDDAHARGRAHADERREAVQRGGRVLDEARAGAKGGLRAEGDEDADLADGPAAGVAAGRADRALDLRVGGVGRERRGLKRVSGGGLLGGGAMAREEEGRRRAVVNTRGGEGRGRAGRMRSGAWRGSVSEMRGRTRKGEEGGNVPARSDTRRRGRG